MALSSAQVTVTSSAAAQLCFGQIDGMSALVKNTGATTVFIGSRDVTAGSGYPVEAAAEYNLDLGVNEELWAITASGTSTVAVLRTEV